MFKNSWGRFLDGLIFYPLVLYAIIEVLSLKYKMNQIHYLLFQLDAHIDCWMFAQTPISECSNY